MAGSYNTAEHNEIFLQMRLNKALERDQDGNVIFTVEASNENLDIEQQRVLQSALLKTKDYFLKSGVVSKDHRHRTFNKDGTINLHEEFVIGEPLDVFTKGNSTFVKGKLYAKNDYAKNFIELLDNHSSRVRASVGGLVPRIKKTIDETGKKIGEVISVYWDDLALTIYPVNHTVEPAVSIAKSLSSYEFVKALSAGYGTDSATFTGGRALIKEDVKNEKISLPMNEKVIAALAGAIADGDVTSIDDAESFLADFGISSAEAREVFQAVCNKSNLFMEVFPMDGKTAWDTLKEKLMGKSSGKPGEDEELNLNGDGSGTDGGGDDDEYENATEVIKSLADKVGVLEESLETMAKAQAVMLDRLEKTASMQKSLGEGMVALLERSEETPSPRKGAVSQLEATLAKAIGGGTPATGGAVTGSLRPFTPERIDRMKDILIKSVTSGEISINTCGLWETQMNNSVGKASYPFTADFAAYVQKKLSA